MLTAEEEFEKLYGESPPVRYYEFLRYIGEYWFYKGYAAGASLPRQPVEMPCGNSRQVLPASSSSL